MNEAEFMSILDKLAAYLAASKTFIENPFRVTEFKKAIGLSRELFPDAKIEIKDDPLQMGAMILHIEDFDLDVTETDTFAELVQLADNWEAYALENGNVCLAAVFQNVLVRI